eukprot:TRINITY_DN15590_c0_g1_i1.p1 TRINITY_DN15590_c0_g1~~TRINITY_DN15590_c0_g1_i1.p1  ORF type:complete len:501 (-),score=83.92 TRINITY_DN15590_c0_g1_i1:59-1561(-)
MNPNKRLRLDSQSTLDHLLDSVPQRQRRSYENLPNIPSPSSSKHNQPMFVKLPHSNTNVYVCHSTNRTLRKWDQIVAVLSTPITSVDELEEAILQYNSSWRRKWSFRGLKKFINILSDKEKQHFFKRLIPGMVDIALQLPFHCGGDELPLLRSSKQQTFVLSRKLVSCLLANAFFCTIPQRNFRGQDSKFTDYPSINFDALFRSEPENVCFAKLRCIFHYFDRIITSEKESLGDLKLHRRVFKTWPQWDLSTRQIGDLRVDSKGTIEDEGSLMLQVDFCNAMIGGGVISSGSMQEEIMFLMRPELIVTRLLCARLKDNECLFINGSERFNNYEGYGNTFSFAGDHIDKNKDSTGNVNSEIVAIDAIKYNNPEEQYEPRNMIRDLNKAFSGFSGFSQQNWDNSKLPIASGNWGSGCFRGSKHLKSLLQLMVVSEAGRELVYFTFGDDEFAEELKGLHAHLKSLSLTVGDLWRGLIAFGKKVQQKEAPESLFDFLICFFGSS